jgi:SecD/SecF fusion protein
MAWYSILQAVVGQAEAAAPAANLGDGLSVGLKLIIAVGVIASSFGLGVLIARRLRMPDFGFKIGVVLFALIASVVINVVGWPPKRGIDLSGGVVLIYEVDKSTQPSAMQATVARLNDLLNEGGGEKLEARPNAKDQIEIELPEGVDAARVSAAIRGAETEGMQFSSAGKRAENGKTVFVYNIRQAQQSVDMAKLIAAVSKRINPGGIKEVTIRQYGAEQLEVIVPEVEASEIDHIKKLISTSGVLEFRILANETDHRDVIKAAERSTGRDVYIAGRLVGRWVKADERLNVGRESQVMFRENDKGEREVLIVRDPFDVTGKYLRRAAPGFDQGQLAVQFSFDSAGGEKFGQLTQKNLPDTATGFKRHLGIILDNLMLSAPTINSTIHENGIIQGSFTQPEVDFLVGVLNAGSLPATLNPQPISEQKCSAQLGSDTIYRGTLAIVLSTVAILLFMAVYYRFCGLVADIAVTLNMIVTVALMIVIHAAFTLPGLAGLVLTVGMAVDANVLIYERMREETERGASLRMAIRNGFSRAMATIIDSHVTTIMSGVVLYIVGTDQIRGFAVTLVIGLLLSLFTAVFVARVIFDIAERKRWLTQLKMMHLIGHTNIDFIRWRGPAIAASVIISVIGLIACWQRGQGLLDIDFTGGSSVQIQFAEGKERDIAQVRQALEPRVDELPDIAVSSVGEQNREFKIDTSNHDIKAVQQLLRETFGDALQTYGMQYGEIAMIDSAAPASSKPADDSPAAGPDLTPPAQSPPSNDESKAPADTKPETNDPAPAPPASDESKPKEEARPPKSSRHERSTAIQLASADPDTATLELALAQEAAEPAATESKPDAPSAAEKETPATEKPAADEAAEEKPAAGAPVTRESLVGGSRVRLTFPQKISYPPLHDMVERELAELNLAADTPFELSNPKYQAGSDVPYAEWTLEIKLDKAQAEKLVQAMQAKMASTPVFPSSNQIGGKVAGDTQLIALYALLASMAIIVVYIWFRFENVIFGLAAVLALVHDVLVTVAFLAVSYYVAPYLGFLMVDPFKISLSVVAALLTIVGFSINDTIVVFDRIREVRGKSPDLTEDMINQSVNQTLSRTILTSGTVFIASVILYFIGGPGIHAFAYAMVVGVIAGTFSSIYIAAPVLLWMKKQPVSPSKPSRSTSGRSGETGGFYKPSQSTTPGA